MIDEAMPLLMLGLAIGVWLAVVYKLFELPFGLAVTVESAPYESFAEEWPSSSAVW